MIDIARSLSIPGWMTETELYWLADQATRHHCIVEIGSYLGRSTYALAAHTPGIVIAIDDWLGPRDMKCDKENLLARFEDNLAPFLRTGKTLFFIANHRGWIPDTCPDMVFIDGDHRYENVKADILMWKEKMMPDGLLCGHDFDSCPGVAQAVKELLPGYDIVKDCDIWVAPLTNVPEIG
jgi:predicted O-methyltransferase YrrM